MDSLYAWTLILCIGDSPQQTACDLHHRMAITGPRVYDSDELCEDAWRAHVRALEARPGWAHRVIVDTYLCGWGTPIGAPDPFYDLRQENIDVGL
jgi:hypothetical protein